MNRFVRKMLLSALAMSTITPAFAQSPVAPTVPRGSFHCFRGMPESEINYVDDTSARPHTFRIGTKLGNSKWDNTDGHDLREVYTEGKLKVLVLIVNFQDTKFSQGKEDPNALIHDMLNGENFTYQNATGSANQFYRTVSDGQFDPQFDIYGPIQLSGKSVDYVTPTETPVTNPDGYYTDASGNLIQKYPASRAVGEAIMALKDQVDFSEYDSNNDGYVDFVYMFYAGKGATTGGGRYTTIWPHAYTLTAGLGEPIELNGVKIDRYACSAELGANNKLSGIGTFCHEFGHVLGLPDIYDTANNGSAQANFTAGPFTCMDSGNYNNDEHTPPYFSSYEQYSLEWMLPTTVTGGGTFTMLPMTARKFAYKFETTNPQEYFLIETRDKSSLDYYLPCHGLAVWHIDFNLDIWSKNTPNNNDSHQRIDLIEADNDRNNTSRDGDLFPGAGGICSFTENVSPSFIDWSNNNTGYRLTRIRRNFDGTVTFNCESFAGTEMPGATLAAPQPELIESAPEAVTVRFPAIEGANLYYISAYPVAKFDGTFINEYVDGYYFRPVSESDGYVTVTIDGLQEGASYGIMAYAANDVNAVASATPLIATTVADRFEEAKTAIFALATGDDTPGTIISWMPVNGATSYDLTVVQRSAATPAEAIENVDVPFTGNRMPDDWDGNGSFDSRSKYCGEATPSYQLAHSGAYLRTGIYDNPIKSVSFWARNRFDENLCHLNVYGIAKDGSMRLVTTVNDLSNKGGRHNIDFPSDCYGVNFVYFFTTTGLDCNLDDIVIEFTDTFIDLPVADLDITPVSETSALVIGLQGDTEYVAYVTPMRGEEQGIRSNELTFTPASLPVSGVEEISVDNSSSEGFLLNGGVILPTDNEPYSIYAIDGTLVGGNIRGSFTLPQRGLYIVMKAEKSRKICW